MSLKIIDDRKQTSKAQVKQLFQSLEIYGIEAILHKTAQFLEPYVIAQPKDLSIKLIEGKLGDGTIKGNTIEIQLPRKDNVISEMKKIIRPLLSSISERQKDLKSEELVYINLCSTIIHEGVHGLLDSKPGSQFAQDFERISGMPNEQGKTTTLLDEGIAYAIQGIYAPEIQFLGSLASAPGESEPEELRQRKLLGEQLRPTVKSYIGEGKTIDEEFFITASDLIKQL